MHRSYLLLFALLLGMHALQAQIQTKELILQEVSVDTVYPQQIKLKWQFENDIENIVICRCTNSCNYENYDPIDTVPMGQYYLGWIDSTSITVTQNYYSITEQSAKSRPQNNMVLDTTSLDCRNSVVLSWNPYINMIDPLDGYRIFYRKNTDSSFILFKFEAGVHYQLELGDNFPTQKITDTLRYLVPNTIYEFVIQAISKNRTVSSFSNMVKYKTGEVDFSSITLDLICASVRDDKEIEIDVITDPFPLPLYKLYLQKSIWEDAPLDFQTIDSLKYHFTDKNVNPKAIQYYYKAVADSKCTLSSFTSNIISNIYLKGSRAEQYEDSILFFHKSYDPSEFYQLYRIVNGIDILIKDSLLITNGYCRYSINVEPFMDDGDEVTYFIKSQSGCFSNTLTIAHEPLIDFPTAFYPQSQDKRNKTFYPILKFPSDKDYLFIIYNRWGQELYRSTLPPDPKDIYYENLQGRWDGTFQGKECPAGIYAYKITYSYYEGVKKYSKSGSFMLIR